VIRRSLRTLRKTLAPSWLTSGEGELVGYSLDLLKDAALERLRLGLLARFPQNGPNGETAPEDALAALGRDRRVVRGISETSASYAYRLTQWLVERRTAGNAFTLLRQLSAYCGEGFSFRTYDARGNCYSRAVDGTETYAPATSWDWDGQPERWSRFWVVIYPTGIWTTAGTYGDPGTPDWNPNAGQWGVDMPREHVRSLQAIVADWKPEGTRCVHIVLAFDPTSFDPASPEPDGSWGGYSKIDAGVRVPARLSTARYLNGVS
jgi:hypothetical protein